MPVQQSPQDHQVAGRVVLIVTAVYPFILRIADDRLIFVLRDNKPPDIVLRRVDKMAQDFFFTPFCRLWFPGVNFFRQRFQPPGIVMDDLFEV